MTETIKTARHRAACRPVTPLSAFGQAVTGSVGRRTAVAVASSGIILSLGTSSALAAPTTATTPVRTANLAAASVVTDTANDDAVATNATVSVDTDVSWNLGTNVEVESEAPPPPPEPDPEPEVTTTYERTSTQTSRSNERTAVSTESSESSESESSESESSESESSESSSASSSNASGIAAQVVEIAYRYVGTPYVYGGASPSGFDCSGFTSYVYAQVGISLPRSSGAQRSAGYQVSASEARAGDLVWWPGHVGIYLGGNQHIAARQPGTPLHASQIWRSNPTFIRVTG